MPIFNIGDLGAQEGQTITYFWNPIYNVSGMMPWLFVAAGFIFFKENRNKSSLLIIVPILIAFALWITFCKIMVIPAAEKNQYDIVLTSFLAGFTLFCLLSSRLSRIHGLLSLSLLIGLLGPIYTLHLYLSLGFNSARLEWGIMYFVIALMAVIPSFTLAGSFCRKKYSFLRFLSFYSAGLAVFGAMSHLLVVSAYYLVWYSVMMPLSSLFQWWVETLLMCLLTSIPFLILLFSNTNWRARFEKLLKIQAKANEMPWKLELEEQTDNPVNPANPV